MLRTCRCARLLWTCYVDSVLLETTGKASWKETVDRSIRIIERNKVNSSKLRLQEHTGMERFRLDEETVSKL